MHLLLLSEEVVLGAASTPLDAAQADLHRPLN